MRVRMKGLWKPEEDLILKQHVEAYGEGKWTTVPERSGLMRSAKSCRLRWKNYLSPRVKHGKMSEAEEDLIIRMHKLLGNRWSLIAGRLPGRTDNEVKNYWNTHLNKKCLELKGECTSDDIIIIKAVDDDSKKKKVYPNRIDSQPSFSDGPHSITAKESDHQGEEGSTKAKDPLMADDTMIFKYCDIRSPLLPINDNAAFSEAHISLLDSFLSFGTTAGSGEEIRY